LNLIRINREFDPNETDDNNSWIGFIHIQNPRKSSQSFSGHSGF
jgi:hypothetical protein